MLVSDLRTRVEAAAFLRIQPQTLAVWKTTKRYDLPVIMVGRRAMYRQSDLEKFLQSRTVGASAE
jgi:hypothetical protein